MLMFSEYKNLGTDKNSIHGIHETYDSTRTHLI